MGWVKPDSGQVKLNTDGFMKDNSKLEGAAGLIRTETRRWL